MSNVHSPQIEKSFSYSQQTILRAERALICCPFKAALFTKMLEERVGMAEITGKSGIMNDYTIKPMSELVVDNALVWLIQVGILRREVDGQGITDSFRLTPLGRQLAKQTETWRTPSWRDRISNFFVRWLRLPFWVGNGDN